MGVNKKYLFLKRLKDVNYIIISALICYFILHRIIEIESRYWYLIPFVISLYAMIRSLISCFILIKYRIRTSFRNKYSCVFNVIVSILVMYLSGRYIPF
jgi:hypothetical protein